MYIWQQITMDARFKSLFIALIFAVTTLNSANAQGRIICQFNSWAFYRTGPATCAVSNIDPFLCDHLLYAFVGLVEDGQLRVIDPYLDIQLGAYADFNALRQINPELKTLISVGGRNEFSAFLAICRDPDIRRVFVDNLFKFIQEWDFSGANIQYEYAAHEIGTPDDRENFSLLIEELKARFTPAGLILSAVVSADVDRAPTYYDIPRISASLDLINLMAYDYQSYEDLYTDFHAPLYARPGELPNRNVNDSVHLWLSYGIDRSKLIMGASTYGRTYSLDSPDNNGIHAPVDSPGIPGIYTQESGFISYIEVCLWVPTWEEVWSDEVKSAYAYKDSQWMSYDNILAIQEKGRYARNMELGGVFVQSYDLDDFTNTVCNEGQSPMIFNLKNAYLYG